MDHLISWRTSRPIGAFKLATVRKKVITSLSSFPSLQSPVPHLFKSNSVPTESDAKLIYEAISDAQDFLARLEQDSLLQKFNLTKSNKLQLKYRKFIHTHKALLSPIRQLPIELLEIIFMNVYYLREPSYGCPWSNLPVALAISQVSRRWREIALSLHALWDKLPLIEIADGRTREDPYLSFLSDLLQRSGASPTLQIYIYAPSREIAAHPAVDLIVQHSHRLMSLTIKSGYITMNAFDKMRGKLPNLEKLSLHFWSHPRVGRVDVFELAPRLHEVELIGPYPPNLLLPWTQLTTFRETYDGCGVLNLFRDASSTVETLEIVRAGYHEAPVVPPTTLPALSSLSIMLEEDTSGVEQFLNSLTIPAIEDMKISYPGRLLTYLISLFSRSQPLHTLQKLAFCTGSEYMTTTQLLDLFTQLPQLIDLHIMFPSSLNGLSKVFDRSKTPQILPSLKVLMITLDRTFHSDLEFFNDIAQSRCRTTGTSNEHTTVNGAPQSLRVNFFSMRDCLESQMVLNRWEMPSTEKQKEELDRLETWKEVILRGLPDREFGTDPSLYSKLEKPEVLDGLFTCLDRLDLVDIIPLRTSNLHTCVSYLANLPPSFVLPGDDKYHFRQRAKDILLKWTPSILEHIHEYHWVTKGIKSLVYIPDDDDLRSSKRNMDVVYGLKDELDPYVINWSIVRGGQRGG